MRRPDRTTKRYGVKESGFSKNQFVLLNEVKDLEYIHFNTPTSGTQILRDAQDDTMIG